MSPYYFIFYIHYEFIYNDWNTNGFSKNKWICFFRFISSCFHHYSIDYLKNIVKLPVGFEPATTEATEHMCNRMRKENCRKRLKNPTIVLNSLIVNIDKFKSILNLQVWTLLTSLWESSTCRLSEGLYLDGCTVGVAGLFSIH